MRASSVGLPNWQVLEKNSLPENIKNKLFTPKFTTKSKGQGFGLAVVKRMTESLGGTVSFKGEEGKGAKFIIQLNTSK